MEFSHKSVLLNETIDALPSRPSRVAPKCTSLSPTVSSSVSVPCFHFLELPTKQSQEQPAVWAKFTA